MEWHEVRAGEVYAWRGRVPFGSMRPRPLVMRPVLLVDNERVWEKTGETLPVTAHEWRNYLRLKKRNWGRLALETNWWWSDGVLPDDLDRERMARHVAFLREQTGLTAAVADKPRVGPGHLPTAPNGIEPMWRTVHPDEMAPWSSDIENWGRLSVESSDWERWGRPEWDRRPDSRPTDHE